MIRTLSVLPLLLVAYFGSTIEAVALQGQPDFSPALYGDGELWGTKTTTVLPAPNEYNVQSFDKLLVIVNGASGQLPVAEAAPRNPDYNGGRWFTHTALWTSEGMDAYRDLGGIPVLRSYAEAIEQYQLGHLVITPGSFPGGPPAYFQCPLLPVK